MEKLEKKLDVSHRDRNSSLFHDHLIICADKRFLFVNKFWTALRIFEIFILLNVYHSTGSKAIFRFRPFLIDQF